MVKQLRTGLLNHSGHRVFWFNGQELVWGCWDCGLLRIEGNALDHNRHNGFFWRSGIFDWSCPSCDLLEMPF